MGAMKPKENSKDPKKDFCMTPPYAVPPLMKLLNLPFGSTVWEPAAGEGDLTRALLNEGVAVIDTTKERGVDFFDFALPEPLPIITNPPFSIKLEWVERCYELTSNWALLLPVEAIASSRLRALFNANGGVSMLLFDSRIDFKTPDTTWGNSSAQFPTAWFISGFGSEPNRIFDCSIKNEKSAFKKLHRLMGT